MKRNALVNLEMLAVVFAMAIHSINAQNEPISIALEELVVPDAPGLQSFVTATYEGKWIALAGRTDGLHDHRPPMSFPASMANDKIWLIDPESGDVISSDITALPVPIQNQLLSTNLEFVQQDNDLILIGGYGVSLSTNSHTTHGVVSRINLGLLVDAMLQGNSIAGAFEYVEDQRFAVTGGYLGLIDDTLYLVGGQFFDGRYNPHNGPSFTQTYNEKIQKFTISVPGALAIDYYQEYSDPNLLHRRDYNLKPQIMPDGTQELTAFTGVFRPSVDLPWFNTVNIHSSGYYENTGFEQLYSHYHSATMPIFDAFNNSMHNYFFGGIAMYYLDGNNQQVEDSLVPFVKTISRVTRTADGIMIEEVLPIEMDGYLGAGAEFIANPSVDAFSNGVLKWNNTTTDSVLLGYIYGGIESTQPNIFMQSSGSSLATNRIFKVWGYPKTTAHLEQPKRDWKMKLFPNPSTNQLHLSFSADRIEMISLSITSMDGREVHREMLTASPGEQQIELSNLLLDSGHYVLKVTNGSYQKSMAFTVKN